MRTFPPRAGRTPFRASISVVLPDPVPPAESAFYFAREIDGIDSCFRTRIESAYISRVIDPKNERPDLYGIDRRHRLTRNTPPVDVNAIGRAKIVDDDLAAGFEQPSMTVRDLQPVELYIVSLAAADRQLLLAVEGQGH